MESDTHKSIFILNIISFMDYNKMPLVYDKLAIFLDS